MIFEFYDVGKAELGRLIFGFLNVGGGKAGLFFAKRINEIRDEIFFFGTSSDYFFFVFDDDFVVGYFNNFFSGYDEFWVNKGFDWRAFDDKLLYHIIFDSESIIFDFTKFAAFFSFNFESDKMEV